MFKFMDESKKVYFEKELEFLECLKTQRNLVFSEIQLSTPIKITPELLLTKNFKLEYCKLVEVNGQTIYYDAILTKDPNIYLYLSRVDISEARFQTKVYFDSTKLNEVKFFINNLTKLKD